MDLQVVAVDTEVVALGMVGELVEELVDME